jgi:hypothetical protein
MPTHVSLGLGFGTGHDPEAIHAPASRQEMFALRAITFGDEKIEKPDCLWGRLLALADEVIE